MAEKSGINILCATDNNYAPYCGVMLTSVFENNRDSAVTAYILIDKPLQESHQEKFNSLAARYCQQIIFLEVNNAFFEQFPLKGDGINHWSIVTYYRLYAERLLPVNVEKVLYLDCDIVVTGSLRGLFDLDLEDIAVGAVPDMCTEWNEYFTRLKYDKSKGYFNAGALLINLSYWRNNDVGLRCMDYLSEHYDRIFNNDQDVLNAVLFDNKLNLPVTYNYQIQLRMAYFYDGFSREMKEDIQSTTRPLIIHYAAELKPWMLCYYNYPFNKEWHTYRRLSLWKNIPLKYPEKRRFNYFIKRYFLWPLGIMKKIPEMR